MSICVYCLYVGKDEGEKDRYGTQYPITVKGCGFFVCGGNGYAFYYVICGFSIICFF